MPTYIDITADILSWAIARAGYDVSEFFESQPKVKEWYKGEKKPTVKQLQNFSQKVHIPFGYLLLTEPPKQKVPIPFFRTNKKDQNGISLNVYDTILSLQQRQEWLVEYLLDEKSDKLSFVGKFDENAHYKDVVDDIRQVLELDELWASQHQTWEKAFENLTDKIESVGVIITSNGVVGNNNTRPIDVNECRGFVLVNEYAPFMFVNAADAKAAQMFTIVHELAHIWFGESAGFDFRRMQPADDPIELICDQVAAEFLVPQEAFRAEWKRSNDFKRLGKIFKVSPIVIGRRALDLKLITKKEFFAFYNTYISDFRTKKEKQSGGGDFYATSKKRISLTFAGYVNHAVNTNQLLYRDAYRLLGLKGGTYDKFIKEYF